MKIDKTLHVPLYRQVEQVLEEKVKTNQWPIGYQLPTENELAELFDVSTITVKRAVIELVNKGYLYRQRGKGTFVSGTMNEQDINTLISLTSEEEEEHPHELISYSIDKAGDDIGPKLGIESDAKVIRIVRNKIEKNEPMALEYTYLPYDKCPNFVQSDLDNELVYNILRNKFGISLGRAKMFIRPYIVLGDKAELLQIESGTPVFEWERFTYSKHEEIVEYSKFYVRQDKETYYTEVYL
ncbi:GntR family transcriptional regulator [Neobacillus sp. 114]|uniref:GntR family transcriptional regulator n=1 Tax=Neobacillus sp. 114 TaxID=3048535 RepID=UPI0024C3E8E9|nr:GntR family transcriptional regulator [Neobacillus sp. 114]